MCTHPQYNCPLCINLLNVNCWSEGNGKLRENIVTANSAEIICVTETHLKPGEEIKVPYYTFWGANRKPMNPRAPRGSGGIGILVKNELMNKFFITKCYVCNDNILGLKLCCKQTGLSVIIYCVYLPPANSKYSITNEQILNYLTIELYKQADANYVFICEDFNARTGNKPDSAFEDIPTRSSPDEVTNTQGMGLLDFTNDTKTCILNGRVTPEYNDYTSVTGYKERSVVDYMLTRQADYKTVTKCEVLSCVDMVGRNHWETLISEKCHVPNHSLICMEINLGASIINLLNEDRNLGSKNVTRQRIWRSKGDSYMHSSTAKKILPELLEAMSCCEANQSKLDELYSDLVNTVIQEAERTSKAPGKRHSNTAHKPYWDLELSKAWKDMRSAELAYGKMVKKGTNQDV